MHQKYAATPKMCNESFGVIFSWPERRHRTNISLYFQYIFIFLGFGRERGRHGRLIFAISVNVRVFNK